MPQLSSGGGDDLGANDEMIAFKDEGEQEEKIQENALTERDLADLKSSLVNESETNQSPNAAVGGTEAAFFFHSYFTRVWMSAKKSEKSAAECSKSTRGTWMPTHENRLLRLF